MDTGEKTASQKTLLDYASILGTLDEAISAYQNLTSQQAALQGENRSLVEQSKLHRAQTRDLTADFQTSKDSLAQKNNQLARLYLGLLNSQYGLAKDNASLLKHVEVLGTLRDCDRSLKSASVQTADLIRAERQGSFAAFVNSAREQLAARQSEDQAFLQEVLDRQTAFNKNLVEATIETAELQARNFRAKLLAIMELAYSFASELNGRADCPGPEAEVVALGKRGPPSVEAPPSKFELARLSSQNSRLATENKYLLYVLQCFQNKILELRIPDFPKAMLSTEYLLKNQGFLWQTETPLFLSLGELYEHNHRLQDELARYRASRFFADKEPAKAVGSLDELKGEFRIVSEQLALDQEKVFALVVARLRERIGGQESHLHALQSQLVELQTQARARLVQLEALSRRLGQAESERSRLIEHLSVLDKIQEDFKAAVDLRLRSNGLDASGAAESIKQFIDQMTEHTALVHAFLSAPPPAQPRDFESLSLANQLFDRQTAENARLAFELETSRNQVNALSAEREALVALNRQLEAEVLKNNANEQIEVLRRQLEEKTLMIGELEAKWNAAELAHQAKISELEDTFRHMFSELQGLKRETGAKYQEQVQILLGKERELEARLAAESAAARENGRRALEAKDAELTGLRLRVAELEAEGPRSEARLSSSFAHQKDVLEGQIQAQQAAFGEFRARKDVEDVEAEQRQKEALGAKRAEFEASLRRKEAELNELVRKVQALEHELQIVHVTRDNFVGVLHQALARHENFEDSGRTLEPRELAQASSKSPNERRI